MQAKYAVRKRIARKTWSQRLPKEAVNKSSKIKMMIQTGKISFINIPKGIKTDFIREFIRFSQVVRPLSFFSKRLESFYWNQKKQKQVKSPWQKQVKSPWKN